MAGEEERDGEEYSSGFRLARPPCAHVKLEVMIDVPGLAWQLGFWLPSVADIMPIVFPQADVMGYNTLLPISLITDTIKLWDTDAARIYEC